MKFLTRSLSALLAALGVVGCAGDPAAPASARLGQGASSGLVVDLLDGVVQKNALTRKVALPKDVTASARIGREGGRIAIPGAGFELIVPPGAVAAKTAFSVTAIKGTLVAYEFSPHGITFNVPLVARQDLGGTNWTLLSPSLQAGYFLERANLDQRSATAAVSELINGLTLPLTKQFNWRINHFSGYVVAW